jgi:hypothetical protein
VRSRCRGIGKHGGIIARDWKSEIRDWRLDARFHLPTFNFKLPNTFVKNANLVYYLGAIIEILEELNWQTFMQPKKQCATARA